MQFISMLAYGPPGWRCRRERVAIRRQ
jgi:hypothetical protein